MPWTQDHLLPIIELLPTILAPEDEVPNFHRLRVRMALIERQHFILCVQAWIEDNEHWLAQRGLTIQSGRGGAFDADKALTFFQSREEDIVHAGPDKPERDRQVDILIDTLDLHSVHLNQPFVAMTVEDLNTVRWNPVRAREVLSFKIADAVPDPYTWLGRHSAARQAKALARRTAAAPPAAGRPRL